MNVYAQKPCEVYAYTSKYHAYSLYNISMDTLSTLKIHFFNFLQVKLENSVATCKFSKNNF